MKPLTSKERLHLDASHLASSAVAEDKALDTDDALSVGKELEFTIGLPNIVETDALADGSPLTCGELESTAANRGAELIVAVGLGGNVALLLVGGKTRVGEGWKVGVELASTTTTPHQACRETLG